MDQLPRDRIARLGARQSFHHANHRYSEINQSVFKLLKCHHLPNQKSKINNRPSSIPKPQSLFKVAVASRRRPSRGRPALRLPPPWLWRLAADRREGVPPSVFLHRGCGVSPQTVARASRPPSSLGIRDQGSDRIEDHPDPNPSISLQCSQSCPPMD